MTLVDGRRQVRGEETRAHLLRSAGEVFRQRGYQGTSVAAITEVASTAHGTFYLYFRNKEDVFVQLMTSAMDELYFQVPAGLDPDDPTFDMETNRGRVATFLAVAERYGPLWKALLEATLVSPAVATAWQDTRGRFNRVVADRLRACAADDDFAGVDVDLMADSLCGMLEWFVFTRASLGDGVIAADEKTVDTLSELLASAAMAGSHYVH